MAFCIDLGKEVWRRAKDAGCGEHGDLSGDAECFPYCRIAVIDLINCNFGCSATFVDYFVGRTDIFRADVPVSYTHLTLPTIYSV